MRRPSKSADVATDMLLPRDDAKPIRSMNFHFHSRAQRLTSYSQRCKQPSHSQRPIGGLFCAVEKDLGSSGKWACNSFDSHYCCMREGCGGAREKVLAHCILAIAAREAPREYLKEVKILFLGIMWDVTKRASHRWATEKATYLEEWAIVCSSRDVGKLPVVGCAEERHGLMCSELYICTSSTRTWQFHLSLYIFRPV